MMMARLLVCTCIQGLHVNVRYILVKVVCTETLLVFFKTIVFNMSHTKVLRRS